ncbi:unnamed protein product [Peronospora effusa]|nr:unnamed protein product [Peronospora effusa]
MARQQCGYAKFEPHSAQAPGTTRRLYTKDWNGVVHDAGVAEPGMMQASGVFDGLEELFQERPVCGHSGPSAEYRGQAANQELLQKTNAAKRKRAKGAASMDVEA